ncbi:hypothetical protein HZS_2618 [Henneguya salminicola]|nr:hypothetical protein HZS_2618 [Henneguya salminicola]
MNIIFKTNFSNQLNILQIILQLFLDEDLKSFTQLSVHYITYGCFRRSNSGIRCHGFQGIQ